MLGKTLKRLFILLTVITFVIQVSTESLEINVELDTNEQLNQQTIGNERLDAANGGNDQLYEESIGNEKSNEVAIGNEQLNEHDSRNKASAGHEENDENKHLDRNKKVNRKEKESKSAVWNSKDDLDKIQEFQGFELTPEEMEKFKIWTDGVIPYYIDVVSYSDKVLRDLIRNYLHSVNALTSLNFMELPTPPSNDADRWVFFVNRRGLLGCADHSVKNFTSQGVQQVVLGYDCIATKGELAEAVMSIVGVPAQHNAPDRDQYIKVHIENIMPDKRHLFEKLRDDEWLFHGLEYDFDSITHYDIHKYSANGKVTIELQENTKDLDLAKELSPTDILKIKMLYNYITGNRKLQIPECQKLFKLPSKLKFFPSIPKIPNNKPGRYTGKNKGSYKDAKEIAGKLEAEIVAGAKIEIEQNTNSGEGDNKEDNIQIEQNDKKIMKMRGKKTNIKKKVTAEIDPLALLSDYESDH